MEKLYNQVGISCFKDYLKTKRINIPYNTACDYAKIGETYFKYQEILERIRFTEEEGLKKLLLLDKSLLAHKEEKELVFKKLKGDSFRDFYRFAQNRYQYARADCKKTNPNQNRSLCLTEECIVILPDNKEVLWFDPDLDTNLGSTELSGKFIAHILKAAKDFFLDKGIR